MQDRAKQGFKTSADEIARFVCDHLENSQVPLVGDSNFDSVAAMRLAADAYIRLGRIVSARDILRGNSVQDVIAAIGRAPVAPPSEVERLRTAPLAVEQEAAWIASLALPDTTAYNFHALIRFAQCPDLGLLADRLEQFVTKHPILTATIGHGLEGPEWRQSTRQPLPLRIIEVPRRESSRSALQAAGEPFPFDLERGPLVRWTLLVHEDGSGTLVHAEHHLVHDGRSFEIFLEELRVKSPEHAVDGYLQYAARARANREVYAERARRLLKAGTSEQGLGRSADQTCSSSVYWSSGKSSCVRLPVPSRVDEAISRAATTWKSSRFAMCLDTFLQAWASVRSHPGVVGVAASTRGAEDHFNVGMHVQVVPVPAPNLDTRENREDRVRRLEINLDVALANVPFNPQTYVTEARAGGVLDNVWPQVVFSEYQLDDSNRTLLGQQVSVEPGVFSGATKYPLNVILIRLSERTEIQFEFDTDIVSKSEVFRIWNAMIGTWSEEPDQEPNSVLVSAAKSTHETIAIYDKWSSWTYADLGRTAAVLADQGLSGDRVAIVGVTSAKTFAAEAAVHMAGGTFVAIDSQQPRSRILSMLNSIDVSRVIATDQNALQIVSDASGITCEAFDEIAARATTESFAASRPASVAYVVFTSGSTGNPKPIAVANRSLRALASWGARRLELATGTIVFQSASAGFDASVWEVWTALFAGSTIYVSDVHERRDPFEFQGAVRREAAEVAFSPTPVAELLLTLDWRSTPSMRTLGVGGGALKCNGNPLPFELVNLYGPSEATSVSVSCAVENRLQGPAPIGEPLPYVEAHIVGPDGCVVDRGDRGELWIGGDGVALGYIGDEHERGAQFIRDPFGDTGSAWLYRTGDMVRADALGKMHFLGREDRQVKINGIRVELGEIEATISVLPGVGRCAADLDKSQARVDVWVEAPVGSTVEPKSIRSQLPSHIKAVQIHVVGELPLTSNGKVDFAALRGGREFPRQAEMPRGQEPTGLLQVRESVLLDALTWLQAHGMSALEGSWFDAGGSSLLAANFVFELRRSADVSIDVVDLLEAPNVAQLLQQALGRREPRSVS